MNTNHSRSIADKSSSNYVQSMKLQSYSVVEDFEPSNLAASDCVGIIYLDETDLVEPCYNYDIVEGNPCYVESQTLLCTNYLQGRSQQQQQTQLLVEAEEHTSIAILSTHPCEVRYDSSDVHGPLATSVSIPIQVGSCSSNYGVLPEASHSRPELLSVKSFQPSWLDSNLGIDIETNSEGQVVISKISQDEEGGIFYRSNFPILKVGDQIVSVDKISCHGLTARQTLKLMRSRARRTIGNTNYVTLVVRNQGGDSRIVSSTFVKRHKDSFIGISVRRRNNGDNKAYIQNIDALSPFNDDNNDNASLLHLDDNLLFVNGISVNASGIRRATQAMKYSGIVTMISAPKEERTIMTCQTRTVDARPLQRLFSFANKRSYSPCKAKKILL